ncbi:hypothetical protein BCR35DRAFT_335594 [Leucosporidium creatinivorum]|uniref:BTB domain-containing protein n=1 Tax=Leucosporidium creatinivorum TaxID=106004 RepID=A0A1Y2D8E9_9BASI|nr:hypothetical protein BCR35DRAFT_335594 [Leucosporidium creatinivorum]
MPSLLNFTPSFGVPSSSSASSSESRSSSSARSSLDPAEVATRFLPFLLSPSPSDVLFVCAAQAGSPHVEPKQLWASKSLLSRESGYFAALFSGEWSESAELEQGRTGEGELWLEAPEGVGGGEKMFEHNHAVGQPLPHTLYSGTPSAPLRFTIRTSIRFPLLRAVLLYLYTSHISFLTSPKVKHIDFPLLDAPNTPSLPPPVPPLPIYLLAEYFDIPSLQSLALEAYSSFLLSSPSPTLFLSLFDSTIALHSDLHELVLDLASSAEMWAELRGEWRENRREVLGIDEERWAWTRDEVERRVWVRAEMGKAAEEEREREETRKRTLATVWFG